MIMMMVKTKIMLATTSSMSMWILLLFLLLFLSMSVPVSEANDSRNGYGSINTGSNNINNHKLNHKNNIFDNGVAAAAVAATTISGGGDGHDHEGTDAGSGGGGGGGGGGICQVIENEIWDTTKFEWVANDGRWTNEYGQSSSSPAEVTPPNGYEFDGDWKIVIGGGDSMGWEYQFEYLQPPKRRRVWLRSLKEEQRKRRRQPPPKGVDDSTMKEFQRRQQRQQNRSTLPRHRYTPFLIPIPSRTISKLMTQIRDDYNFKGFGLSTYKSLIFRNSFGLSLRLPLTTNFDTLDRRPEIPSISTSIGFFYPWTVAAYLSGSVRIEWLKWLLKSILVIIPRILIFVCYKLVLPLVWTVISTLMLTIRINSNNKLPQLPKAPTIHISKPSYNPVLSERIGCSLSYRWSKSRGYEWRFAYWHSYLPTLIVYQRLLRLTTTTAATQQTIDWWQKHFGSIGLSTGVPIPVPPYYSCSACLSLSGLYFQRPTTTTLNTVDRRNKLDLLEEEDDDADADDDEIFNGVQQQSSSSSVRSAEAENNNNNNKKKKKEKAELKKILAQQGNDGTRAGHDRHLHPDVVPSSRMMSTSTKAKS